MENEVVIQPPDVRIEIDLNSRSRDGYVLARLSRADGPVLVDDQVVVFEPGDRIAAPAHVVRVDRARDFVYLDVDWVRMDDDPAYGRSPQPVMVGLRNRLSNAAAAVSMRFRATEHIWVLNLMEPEPQAAIRAVTR